MTRQTSRMRKGVGTLSPEKVTKSHRYRHFTAFMVWSFIPLLALVLVSAYIGLSVERQVYPPVVPVEGRSMNPLLHFGDLVFLKKANFDHLGKGYVIAFRTSSDVQQKWNVPGSYVHRIVAGKDPFWTVEQNVIGVYAGKINDGGYPILFFRSRQGKILLGDGLLIMFLYWLLGVFERRRAADAVNVYNLATIVEEARRVTQKMEEVVLAVHPPPNAIAPANHPLANRHTDVSADAHPTTGVADENRETMRQLVGSIGEYGQHLQSHTAVMQGLAATTAELQGATMEMRQAITASPRIQPVLVPEMPHLKKSVRGYSRKAVRELYEQMSADLGYTRGTIERLDHDLAEIRGDRDRLARDLTQSQQLQASLAASLAVAEERLRGVLATPAHISTIEHSSGAHQGGILTSLALGAIEKLARRFGNTKNA